MLYLLSLVLIKNLASIFMFPFREPFVSPRRNLQFQVMKRFFFIEVVGFRLRYPFDEYYLFFQLLTALKRIMQYRDKPKYKYA